MIMTDLYTVSPSTTSTAKRTNANSSAFGGERLRNNQSHQSQVSNNGRNNLIPYPTAAPSPLPIPPPPLAELSVDTLRTFRSHDDDNVLADDDSDSNDDQLLLMQLPPTAAAAVSDLPPDLAEESAQWRTYAASVVSSKRCYRPAPLSPVQRTPGVARQQEDDFFRGRRKTVTSRFPISSSGEVNSAASGISPHNASRTGIRKLSASERPGLSPSSAIDPWQPMEGIECAGPVAAAGSIGSRRRLSAPDREQLAQRSLLSANYAILRRSVDLSTFEIVAAFHKCQTGNSDAFRHYFQSLTCYDLVPQHGIVTMLDANLVIRKAITILCMQLPPRVALICNLNNHSNHHQCGTGRPEGTEMALFSITDCLHVLRLSTDNHKNIGNEPLAYFIDNFQKRRGLVSVATNTTVWDLARLFLLNRVHRIPIFDPETNELVSILGPRLICIELLKLLNSKCTLSPDLQSIKLHSRAVGTWTNLATIYATETCARAIDIFLEKRVSSLPVLDPKDSTFLGVIDKNSLIDAVAHHGADNYPMVMEMPVKSLMLERRGMMVSPNASVAEAIRLLLLEDGFRESLFVVDNTSPVLDSPLVLGAISYTDIIGFLLNGSAPTEQQQQQQQPLQQQSPSIGSGGKVDFF